MTAYKIILGSIIALLIVNADRVRSQDLRTLPGWVQPVFRPHSPPPRYRQQTLSARDIEWLRQVHFLPPEKYDHPYAGIVQVIRTSEKAVRAACPGKFSLGAMALGCASHIHREPGSPDKCVVYILEDDALDRSTYDYELVLRHERAHCNGWRHAAD